MHCQTFNNVNSRKIFPLLSAKTNKYSFRTRSAVINMTVVQVNNLFVGELSTEIDIV